MLIALTIMVFLILVIVALHYNDHAKEINRTQNTQEEMLKYLRGIEVNTRSIK